MGSRSFSSFFRLYGSILFGWSLDCEFQKIIDYHIQSTFQFGCGIGCCCIASEQFLLVGSIIFGFFLAPLLPALVIYINQSLSLKCNDHSVHQSSDRDCFSQQHVHIALWTLLRSLDFSSSSHFDNFIKFTAFYRVQLCCNCYFGHHFSIYFESSCSN